MKTIKLAAALSAVLFSSLTMADASTDALQLAVEHQSRTPANVVRDPFRNPAETLAFFNVTPNSTVVEISPGGGWYTEILAPLLAAHGTYYAAHFPAETESDYYKRSRAAFVEKLASNPIYNRVQLTEFSPTGSNTIAPEGSADVVLTFRNLHNWYNQGGDEALVNSFKQFYAALKPGGVLGVVEHRLPADKMVGEGIKSGYFPQALTVKAAEQAGFEFQASSEVNANAKDTADYAGGVWTLPPSFRLKDQDKDKYMAIGESDRMTLKFVKPAAK